MAYYISTPIYYPSGKLTMGNAYTTVLCDALARYHRLMGEEVFFLTGTDEHGLKLQRKAEETGVTPKTYVDYRVSQVQSLWDLMNVRYDHFIRTTDAHHEAAVQTIFQKLWDQGDIYLGHYKGHYCAPCEAYWTETQMVDGCCPDCGRPLEMTEEACYFFRLSKYQDRLIQFYEDHPDWIQPRSRMNEMLNNFIRPGLEDLAVSRTTFDWGVKVPFDPEHVVYVWIDALSNYVTALGYPETGAEGMQAFWPGDLQVLGKDIVRFHGIIWPILLMALDLPLPKQLLAHGWLLSKKGDKMSKSKGNSADPTVLSQVFPVDALRYYLLRELPFGQDGQFSLEALTLRYNVDLANDLGNLLSRSVAMQMKYFPEGLPEDRLSTELEMELLATTEAILKDFEAEMKEPDVSKALQSLWKIISRMNKYIDETMPWALAKVDSERPRLAEVLYRLLDQLRRIAILLQPFMPETAQKMMDQLGLSLMGAEAWTLKGAMEANRYPTGLQLTRQAPLFPRLDLDETLARLEELGEAMALQDEAREAAAFGKEA